MLQNTGKLFENLNRQQFQGLFNNTIAQSSIGSFDFENATSLPEGLTYTRSGNAWYNDSNGYLQVASANIPRFGSIFDTDRGILVELAIQCTNTYARPSTGVVGSHFSAGSSIASIITDSDNPAKDLTSGTSVWELDNSGGGSAVNVEWTGGIASGKASGFVYAETVSGDDPTLSISGNGTQTTHHTVAGYTLYKVEDRTVAATEVLRLSIPAGAVVRVAAANLQEYDVCTSFIDTAGSTITRGESDLNGDAPFFEGVTEGTILYDFTFVDDPAQSGNIFEARDITTDQRFTIWQTGGNYQTTVKAGTVVVQQAQTSLENLTRMRSALSYKTNEFRQSNNGFTSFTDTSGAIPDVDAIAVATNALSFNSANRSGSQTINGVVHRFRLITEAVTESVLNQLTDPNSPSELWVGTAGDSNLERWAISFSGAPQARFENNIKSQFANSFFFAEGKSGSTANYDAAQALSADWWSGQNDIGGGNIYNEALDRNEILTKQALRKIDYVIVNLGANDLRKIGDATITTAEYKASFQNVIDQFLIDYGSQVKFVMQNQLSSNNADFDDADMQSVREAMRELVAANSEFIGEYDGYDLPRSDTTHLTEDGYNSLVDRASNVILANQGLATPIPFPSLVSANFGAEVIKLTFSENLTGSDASVFRILDDASPLTISDIFISGTDVYILTSATIVSTSIVTVEIGYGKMSSLVSANAIQGETTGYPLKSTGQEDVSYSASLDIEYVTDGGEFVIDNGELVIG